MVSGSLEPVAERMFNELPYDAFFIEWEDIKREGGYEALRFVPKGKMVIMGIVDSKVPEESNWRTCWCAKSKAPASKTFSISPKLGISPEFGFASTMHGNELQPSCAMAKARGDGQGSGQGLGRSVDGGVKVTGPDGRGPISRRSPR